MKKTVLAIVAVAATVSTLPRARADEFDKKTSITVNETILIPGRTLPPGKYVMKLANVTSNRHVVQIFNENQNKLEATTLAFNNYRMQPTSKTVLQYWETPKGSPPALRAWFFPGDNYGQEFAYPRDMAERLARENNAAKIPSYEASNTTPSADQFAKLEVRDVDQTPAPTQTASASTTTEPATTAKSTAAPPNPKVAVPATTTVASNTVTAPPASRAERFPRLSFGAYLQSDE